LQRLGRLPIWVRSRINLGQAAVHTEKRDEQLCSPTFTLRVNLEACFWSMEAREDPCMHRENMPTPHRRIIITIFTNFTDEAIFDICGTVL